MCVIGVRDRDVVPDPLDVHPPPDVERLPGCLRPLAHAEPIAVQQPEDDVVLRGQLQGVLTHAFHHAFHRDLPP